MVKYTTVFTPRARWLCAVGLTAWMAVSAPGCRTDGRVRMDERAAAFLGGAAAHRGDWCDTHGVPESQCTRCNPSLAAGFQGRGDWCAEHSVPDSQCALCHPELLAQGVAPPEPARGAQTPRELRLSPARTADRIGVETAAAQAVSAAASLSVPLRVEFDPTALARVSARVSGVVLALSVHPGERVRAGQRLAVLQSSEAASMRAGLTTARARLSAAELSLARALRMQGAGAGAHSEVERAEVELAAARAELRTTTAAAGLVGAGGGDVVIATAPRDGTVVRLPSAIGQHVAADDVLAEVADVSTMAGVLDVPESDAGRVRAGLSVTMEIDGVDDAVVGTIQWVSPSVDPRTRTVQARVSIANPDEQLRANAFGRATVRLAARDGAVLVPRDAVHALNGEDVVFVERAPAQYAVRTVRVERWSDAGAELRSGVAVGERVVTTGGFELKSAMLQDRLGDGCGDEG